MLKPRLKDVSDFVLENMGKVVKESSSRSSSGSFLDVEDDLHRYNIRLLFSGP